MAGIGPAIPPSGPNPLTRTNKDGGGAGGGGRYTPQRHKRDDDHDEADISPEALKKLAEERDEAEREERSNEGRKLAPHIKAQEPAAAQPESANARLEILAEIQSFNELHQRLKSRLTARMAPIPGGSALLVEDGERGVTLKPFGDRDIFHFSFQEVRTKLQAFDQSAGSHFDGVV